MWRCAVLKDLEGVVSRLFPVALARGRHLFPFRTEQLSPSAPMVLGSQGPGRVGRRRFFMKHRTRAALGRLVVVLPQHACAWTAIARHAPSTYGRRRTLDGWAGVLTYTFKSACSHSYTQLKFLIPTRGLFIWLDDVAWSTGDTQMCDVGAGWPGRRGTTPPRSGARCGWVPPSGSFQSTSQSTS